MQTEDSALAASRWLVTVTQLPTEDPAGRMRMLRTLESLGAAVMREGVYVLPDTPANRHALERLAQQGMSFASAWFRSSSVHMASRSRIRTW